MGSLRQSIKMHLAARRRQYLPTRILGSQCRTGWIGVSGFGKASRTNAPADVESLWRIMNEHGEGSCWEFDPTLGRREDIGAWKRCKMTMMTFSQGNWISGNRTSRNVGKRSRGGTFVDKTFQGA
ncbi:hypothetical protein CPC08DRAFT_506870 [Agrocybe pediades]|nr:hypothetical protein CPC08DRAFT_506870 [Agrocybe pediades]